MPPNVVVGCSYGGDTGELVAGNGPGPSTAPGLPSGWVWDVERVGGCGWWRR